MKNKQLLKTPKDKRQFKKWIKALRSGNYKQGKGYLQSNYGYCCLGVACKILIPKAKLKTRDDGAIAGGIPEVQRYSPKWLKDIDDDFKEKAHRSLTSLNDKHNNSFDEIADLLEIVYIHKADFETKES